MVSVYKRYRLEKGIVIDSNTGKSVGFRQVDFVEFFTRANLSDPSSPPTFRFDGVLYTHYVRI